MMEMAYLGGKFSDGNLEKDMVIRKPKFFQIRQGL
jgi:hypothetical protein